MSDDAVLLERARAEMADLIAAPAVTLVLSALDAFMLIGELQLALRHDLNVGAPAVVARRVAEQLQDALANEGALAEIAARGWDPAHDG